MTTLHFSPEYDSGVWAGDPERGTCKVGECYTGPLGLLSLLEEGLGITAAKKTSHEILAAYLKAAREAASRDPGIFFRESLESFPLSTTRMLLRWRDELVLAGWSAESAVPDGLTTGAKAILFGLKKVEGLIPEGLGTTSARWWKLTDELGKHGIGNGLRVIVHVPEDHLHPAHKYLLDLLRGRGVKVERDCPVHVPETEVEHFRDSVDACLKAASQGGDALLVCSDEQTLSSAQAAFGLPRGNSTSSGAPLPVEHIFTSAMMLLLDGSNILAFRDYLSSPCHPLNKFTKDDCSLRGRLLRSIRTTHGFEKVDAIVEEFAGGDPAVLSSICEWLPEPEAPLTYDRVCSRCRRLSAWAEGCIEASKNDAAESPYLGQWAGLAEKCSAMEFQCKKLGFDTMKTIPASDFVQVLSAISTPSECGYLSATVGSASVVCAIGKIAVPVKDVIWVNGSFSEVPVPLAFMCQEDVNMLAAALPFVWKQNDAFMLNEDIFSAGLSRIEGTLTLLCCDTFAGERREKHPFILRELKKKGMEKIEDVPFADISDALAEPCVPVPVNTVQDEYNFNPKGLGLPDHESPSTLDDMFDQPFDWLAKSVLGLREEGDTNLSLIEGIVAHDVIHRLYLEAAGNGCPKVTADAFDAVFQARFDEFFEGAVLAQGAELTLKENTLEREQFKTALQSSAIPRLIDIIRESGLTIIGSEVRFENVDITQEGMEPLKVTGIIDMLLENRAGLYVIIDFKWAKRMGRNRRWDEVKKGTDYQLAIYRNVVERGGISSVPAGEVDAQAYYMLKTAELLTAYDCFRTGGEAIATVPPSKKPLRMNYPDTVRDIQEKYSETVRDVRAGTVPVGNIKSIFLDYKVLKGKLS